MEQYFKDYAGLLRDLLSYAIVNEENAGRHYTDYAFCHPLLPRTCATSVKWPWAVYVPPSSGNRHWASWTTRTKQWTTDRESAFPTIQRTKIAGSEISTCRSLYWGIIWARMTLCRSPQNRISWEIFMAFQCANRWEYKKTAYSQDQGERTKDYFSLTQRISERGLTWKHWVFNLCTQP